MPKITSETDSNSHGSDERSKRHHFVPWLLLSVFVVISTFSYQIYAVTKLEKLILFIDLDAEFNVLKLLFEDFSAKIIREAGNCERLLLRVNSNVSNKVGTVYNNKDNTIYVFITCFLF